MSPAKLAAGPPPSTTYKPAKLLFWAVGPDNAESSEPASPDAPEPAAPVDPVELAFSKANAYKADYNNDENSAEERNVGDETPKDLPDSVKIAIEKAKKYKQNKAVAAVTETTQGNNNCCCCE